MTESIEQFANQHFERLDFLTKAIARVHGENHPELKEVREVFLKMADKKANGNYDFKEEMATLENLSQNFLIPGDACEAYTGAYNMLKEFDTLVVK